MTNRLEVGHVSKAHGLRGELIFSFSTDRTVERTAPGAVLFLDGEAYSVIRGQAHGKKWLLALEGITTKEQADELRGRSVTAEPIDDADTVFVHELIGNQLVDQHGVDRGKIVSVIDNPASDLLELESGGLVPLAFFVSMADGIVRVEVPDGLFETDD